MISDMNHGKNNITDLIETYAVKFDDIDTNAFFLSLTDNALNAGLLTDKDMTDIQSQIYDILSDNIWVYTKGTSVSVTSTEANDIMREILYTLDCFCMSETPNDKKLNDLIKLFKEKAGIKKCYQNGIDFMKKTGKPSLKEINAKEFVKNFDISDEILDSKEFREFEKNQKPKIKIISQSTMSDVEFNMLCADISKFKKNTGEKADMIIKAISSAGDFLDILNAQCLFGDEYIILYEKLWAVSKETIAFLIKTTLSGSIFFDFDVGDLDSFANDFDMFEEEWQEYLAKFISELNGEDKKKIAGIIQNS